MHTLYSRAAVDTRRWSLPVVPCHLHTLAHTITLWADRPLAIRQGRLIAVRLHGDQLQVRLVDRDNGTSIWRPADGLITEFQAQHWVATSRFRR